jgi:monomeric isocitrate dehydrogenase
MFHKLRNKPLSKEFNEAVVRMANKFLPDGFEVSDNAPSTYNALVRHLNEGNKMVVYGSDANNSIYADSYVNHCFRAWHDWCHWQGKHDFSLAGEIATYELMCEQIIDEYGRNKRTFQWCKIMEIEVVEQRLFYERYGQFVLDQSAFFDTVRG